MRIHFIAIGGAAMHNLAIALHKRGEHVTGSDDEIFEPSRSLLKDYGLLPDDIGWNADRIATDIDLIILGMHARIDNPELLKARKLGIPINSYPEFLYNRSKDKKRIVVAGSHGKTTTTSMILHVLKTLNFDFDFMVGARIKGFDTMVKLSDAPVIILEGDEYFSSPIDMRAKFLWYKPDVALITGIAWDHINVYPTLESYEQAFQDFIMTIRENGTLCYYENDADLKIMAKFVKNRLNCLPYDKLDHVIRNEATYVLHNDQEYPMQVFGEHNLQNMQGAKLVCESLNISDEDFYTAMSSFEGSSNRLEILAKKQGTTVIKDFAHSPSKLKATVAACKNQFKDGRLLAVIELHTFSSLNREFLKEYQNTMEPADVACVYYDPETVTHKKLLPISPADIRNAFGDEHVQVFTDADLLRKTIVSHKDDCRTFLLMSSGKFNGIDLKILANELTS